MSKYITVTPAYGRDYKSAKAAKTDWNAGKDFILQDITSPWDGKPINKEQADAENYKVNIRYKRMTQICNA